MPSARPPPPPCPVEDVGGSGPLAGVVERDDPEPVECEPSRGGGRNEVNGEFDDVREPGDGNGGGGPALDPPTPPKSAGRAPNTWLLLNGDANADPSPNGDVLLLLPRLPFVSGGKLVGMLDGGILAPPFSAIRFKLMAELLTGFAWLFANGFGPAVLLGGIGTPARASM